MSKALIIHVTPYVGLPYIVTARLISPRVLIVIFSEPMILDDGKLYDVDNYSIVCPDGTEQLNVISVWGYSSYPYPYPHDYSEYGYAYDYGVYSLYPEEGGMYSVFVLLDGDPVADEDYILVINTDNDGPTDLSGDHLSIYGNTAHFTGYAIPQLLSVTCTERFKLLLQWNTPISPGYRDSPLSYSLTSGGNSVDARVVSVISDNRIAQSEYYLYTTRLTHNGRYSLNVLGGILATEYEFVVDVQDFIFNGIGIIPSFRVVSENSNELLVVFDQNMIITNGLRDYRNYSFTNGLGVTGVEIVDKKTIRLYTTKQERDTLYSLRIGRSEGR